MKRYFFFCLLGFIALSLYAQTAEVHNFTFQMLRKTSKFFGHYLPLDFVEDFEKSRDWFSSRKYIAESEYIYIRIAKNGIWVQEPILGDGFTEELIDYRNGIENYKYQITNNNEIIIFKNDGNKYKKISNTFEHDFSILNNYIGRIVLQDFIASGEIILDSNIITIPALDYGKFRIETWYDFDKYYASLYLYGFDWGWDLDMEVEGGIITIYTYDQWIWGDRYGKKIYWRNKIK